MPPGSRTPETSELGRRRSRVSVLSLGVSGLVLLLSGPTTASAAAPRGGPSAVVVTVAGTGHRGASPSGTAAGTAALDTPTALALGPTGALFLADTDNCRIDEVRMSSGRPGAVSPLQTVAGQGCRGMTIDGRSALTTDIGFDRGLAVDRTGDLFVADTSGDRVLEVPAHSGAQFGQVMSAGHLYTVAGTGRPGVAGTGVLATGTDLNAPQGVAVDGAGDVFIADTGNCRVDEVPSADQEHSGQTLKVAMLYPVAGNGTCGSDLGAGADGDGGPALQAIVWTPDALAVDPAGDLFVSDRGDDEVRMIPQRSGTYFGVTIPAGDIATVAGTATGYSPYLTDGLSATGPTAELNFVAGISLDASGDLFIADGNGRAVREVPAKSGSLFGRAVQTGDMYTLVGAVPSGPNQDQSRWVLSAVSDPTGVAVGPGSTLYFVDPGANVVRAVRSSL